MKPDWKESPSWANYVAMDSNGQWYWYELEPTLKNKIWREDHGLIQSASAGTSWEDSLESRQYGENHGC